MPQIYNAPLSDIKFMLKDVFNLDEVLKISSPDISLELVDAILEEAAKFAASELSPLNYVGDKIGCKFDNSAVITPPGFKEAYQKFITGGWNAVPFSTEYGGQGLPWLVSVAIAEIWNGANMAFSLCPLLTQGAVESLMHHGSPAQKEKYLAKLISGEWTGTMCLTEPQAGSDLAAIRTKAIKNGDHYLIKGQKIFITYGEHDYTDNIIHMVLAKLPDAPAGVKGISLFIVPKILDDRVRNDVKAISIEHKLGIHASPTCVMSFGDVEGAVGYLVGEENNGLKYMFTMMNNARLSVGVEGLGISENSYQQAFAYASERVQGKPLESSPSVRGQGEGKNGAKKTGSKLNSESDTLTLTLSQREREQQAIAAHPDVKRMLLTIRAHTESSRAIIYYVARAMDVARNHKDEKIRQINQDIVDLLIPVAKTHATELGFANSSMAMQVFGGVGYIEETGIAQNLRDARIAMIYEGTNGIQAMDLVMRKLILHDGRLVNSFFSSFGQFGYGDAQGSKKNQDMGAAGGVFATLVEATAKIQSIVRSDSSQAAMLANSYIRLFGLALGGILLDKSKEAASKSSASSKSFIDNKIETVDFYMKYLVPEINYIKDIIVSC